ncbi:hypothetical protein C5C18_04805 [Rathayibacter tritici]|uniref:VC0807 family protein n=1 Tax=Rathayibacter tritici TaxID=33888 RepID=UPI000CE7F8D4|nr:VC0807 family protein [Rathayibacter tritici]PPF30365.1 hypothetical protein C5C06_05300 [Rathayibacter tritici]PPF69351.1 hypothetical protein C5C21_02970 [Rathayibacter tritici]PPG08278.1 hypothetical protein C5C18_04805 [Rathayibacter tritici]
MHDRSRLSTPKSKIVMGAVNVAVPVALYYLARALGASQVVGLMTGVGWSLVSTVYVFAITRRISASSGAVGFLLLLSVITALVTRAASSVLVASGIVPAGIGLLMIVSAFVGRPVIQSLIAPAMDAAAKNERVTATWMWNNEPTYRRAMIVSTALWGFLVLAEAVAGIVLAVSLPVDEVVAIRPVVAILIVGVAGLCQYLYIGHLKKSVPEELREGRNTQ